MQKKLILDSDLLDITLSRLCQQLIENHQDFAETVIIGLQPRGVLLAEIIHQKLEKILRKPIPLGWLDTTFHRDDYRRREIPVKATETRIPFVIEGKKSSAGRRCIVYGPHGARCTGCDDLIWPA